MPTPHKKPTPEELQAQIDGLNNPPTPPANPPTPPTPPANPEPPQLNLDEIKIKNPEDLTDDEKKFVEEHADELTEEEKTALGMVTPPAEPPALDLEEIRVKDPATLTEEEKAFLEEKKEELSDEEKQTFGITATPEPPKPIEPKKPDYEKRYKGSSAEAHIIYSKSKKLTEAIENAGNVPEPTEEELEAEYPDWDTMSDTERKLAKDNLVNNRRFSAINEATKEFKDMDTWNKKIDEFIADPEVLADNPDLEGKEEEFRVYAQKETRRGADLKDLIFAFFYEEGKKPRTPNKGAMFPTGTGGLNNKPKPKTDVLTPAEAGQLRTSDYKKYLEYVRAGKIDLSQV